MRVKITSTSAKVHGKPVPQGSIVEIAGEAGRLPPSLIGKAEILFDPPPELGEDEKKTTAKKSG